MLEPFDKSLGVLICPHGLEIMSKKAKIQKSTARKVGDYRYFVGPFAVDFCGTMSYLLKPSLDCVYRL